MICGDCPGVERVILEMKILAVQAIERTGMIKDGQIPIPTFWSGTHGEARIPARASGRTHEIRDTVGGKGIVIERQIALMRAAAFEFAVFHTVSPAVSYSLLGNATLIMAERTSDTSFRSGRINREPVSAASTIVDDFYFRPHFIETVPDALRENPTALEIVTRLSPQALHVPIG